MPLCVLLYRCAQTSIFGIPQHVEETDFLPEKTQERKGFIYDDCWWLSLNPFPNILGRLHPWCLMVFMNQSSMNDESSIFNPLSFPLDCQRTNCGSFVLVERCICVCGSWCGRLCPALWWKDRHIQSKEPWSSFTSHAITHFLYICRL